jgi:hypothetical protein
MKVAIVILIATLVGCASVRANPPPASPTFPLRVSQNGRYLVDQQLVPFFVLGDSAWSLIAQLQPEDIRLYLRDRQQRGFNSLIVNLIEHKFCSRPPRARSGLAPFETPGDLATCNPDYFRFAHDVIAQACDRGIAVWLAPAYLGYGGGDEGFFREMKAGGREKLHSYGAFVGRQFKDLPNIVWLLGGDYTPGQADRWTVTELAAAIREQDPGHLMTVHDAPGDSAASVFGREPWLDVDTVYSYERTLFRPLLAEYDCKPARPFVLIESTYEGEHDSARAQIRRQAYWAVLSGACGQFMGNNPIWHFDGPGLYPAKVSWRQALDQPGSRDTARLGALFRALAWFQLRPEENHAVVTDGFGANAATAVTALTADGKLALTYVPSTGTDPRALMVDTGRFAGPVQARWFNPAKDGFVSLQDTPLPRGSLQRLRTPGDNGTGSNDWLLLLETSRSYSP